MQRLTWLLKLLLQAACFFALFAFALNNQHDVTVNFFFGAYWRGPLVLLVLAVFAGGVLLGALGMAPRWWRDRRAAAGTTNAASPRPTDGTAPAPLKPITQAAGIDAAASRPNGQHGA